jgi:hypothetical protein
MEIKQFVFYDDAVSENSRECIQTVMAWWENRESMDD